ncbi:bifunctional aminoglycoside phosphotransferase/ATP-binding protein [Microbispora sp. ATCC PTA-5024]|uniref:bifunctional aminoglycoside phosphotransferase/ATP-binding protein n=1 Tax=Microbispora sp. ATCC PTA-5024 TaxID=316330 RepID=UPI0003DC6080|nr:bifunctional aminoglycoside phosphotransferase/ATP-binding protein [Microbispora sp. ATCC PTA-5024]ETK32833.1 gluconate kinase [Microbispora sp. ATCC PTA-5024]
MVILLGDRAFKLKKPVDLGFLDFTTLEARRKVCHEEVRLNRRLAPDVYEGVADLVGPDGQVCEHLVVMRRMPDECRLSAMVRAGEPVEAPLRQVARMVASMHTRSPHTPRIDEQGSGKALRSRWVASFNEVRALPDPVLGAGILGEIERLTLRFIDGREPLFAGRVADCRIVDGHGDLLADDIFCLDSGPQILDCLEFDDRLRFLDGLDDAAFLAMDLERLEAPRLAELFLHYYAEFSGDPASPSLWHHYVAYRAFVRTKVACLRHGQGEFGCAREAHRLAELTLHHLQAGAITLVLVGGTPATGKSTLGAAIADRLGYTLLRSDRVRKELAGIPPRQPAPAPFGEGIYCADLTERTYAELLSRAERLLGHGEPVIIDASWTDAAHRAAAEQLARRTSSDLIALRCSAPPSVIAERLARRTSGVSISDADQAVAAVMTAKAAPWPDATRVDTGASPEGALEQALAVIHARHAGTARRFRRPRMEPG